MNLNLTFAKSMNLNLVFSKSMNLNLKITKKMNGSNPSSNYQTSFSKEAYFVIENIVLQFLAIYFKVSQIITVNSKTKVILMIYL